MTPCKAAEGNNYLCVICKSCALESSVFQGVTGCKSSMMRYFSALTAPCLAGPRIRQHQIILL